MKSRKELPRVQSNAQKSKESQEAVGQMVFVARQPVMTTNRDVWGYELLFRGSGEANVAAVKDADMATSSVIADGFVMAAESLPKDRKVLINFPERLLAEDAAFALPADICVIEILEDVQAAPEVLAGLHRLKKAGYSLALDDYVGEAAAQAFLPLVDIVKVDILGLGADPARLAEVVERLRPHGVELLAEKVEDRPTFELTAKMGFNLFQGYFFSRPEVIPGRKLSSSQVSKLHLLKELSSPEFEVDKLAKLIQSDLSLSYRLFRYINSAGYGVRHKVETVSRAIALLGRLQISQWLRAVLLSDLSPTKEATELAFMSVHRARFLEFMAKGPFKGRFESERMFLLGLFSLLDALLGQPMDEILEHVPLDNAGKDALMGRKSPDLGYLEFVRAYERGDWEDAQHIANTLGSPLQESDRLYMEAMVWAHNMFRLKSSGEGAGA
ncbi:MAG: c-di-GMP phosphodiesterase [Desulfovibrionales bacterium]|jgi:EAL and modified HD-GYP domain-containing signal transduction protein|nr:c-di-GMP phosphodiesterase [Desulfovibrionales bacterium]